MGRKRTFFIISTGLILGLSACSSTKRVLGDLTTVRPAALSDSAGTEERRTTIWDAFRSNPSETPVKVNRFIWQASLDVLDFLPIESVDPFSGVIVTGYGTPPGGSKPYRATVYVSDPALDARTLRVALQTRNGPTSKETMRAVEDAILSRARQLRRDAGFF